MNKQVLSPFDCDMCAMIEDITKQEIDERLREWRHTTADRIISGLMGNYQSAKA